MSWTQVNGAVWGIFLVLVGNPNAVLTSCTLSEFEFYTTLQFGILTGSLHRLYPARLLPNTTVVAPYRLHQITCKGANVVGCNPGQGIFQRNYNDNTWTQLPGGAVWASAGIDYSIWCCNSWNHIYRSNAGKGQWDRMPGSCVQIDAWTNDRAVCVDLAQELFEFQNGSWRQLPGGGTHITIGANGEKWVVNASQAIYRMLPGETQWTQMPGGLRSIHCTDGNNVAGSNSNGDLYRWNGSGWTKLPGGGTHIGITWGNMWVVNSNGSVYQSFI